MKKICGNCTRWDEDNCNEYWGACHALVDSHMIRGVNTVDDKPNAFALTGLADHLETNIRFGCALWEGNNEV